MKRIFLKLTLASTLMIYTLAGYAAGGIAHMYIAKELIPLLPDAKARNLILDNMDAYLVGANYPDTGYLKGTDYGEDSHWEPFISTYIAYLRDNYAYPEQQNPKLVAFLLGIASHSLSDIVFHWTLLDWITLEDFSGNREKAHTDSELGIDVMLTIEQNQWLVRPKVWWVPVKDLVAIYHRMGKDQYTAQQIIWGNSVYSTVGIGERIIAPAAYLPLKFEMPWTAKNYLTTPLGGMSDTEQLTALYVENVWERVTGKTTSILATTSHSAEQHATPDYIQNAVTTLEKNPATVSVNALPDGSVEIN